MPRGMTAKRPKAKHPAAAKRPLNKHLKWNTFAGGTSAMRGKSSYAATTPIGQYHIWPPSAARPHSGYHLMFATSGAVQQPGLWRDLGTYRSPNAAKTAAKTHFSTTPVIRPQYLRKGES